MAIPKLYRVVLDLSYGSKLYRVVLGLSYRSNLYRVELGFSYRFKLERVKCVYWVLAIGLSWKGYC